MSWQENGSPRKLNLHCLPPACPTEFFPLNTNPSILPSRPLKIPFPFSSDEKTGQHSAEDYAKSSRPIYDARRLKSLFDDKPDGRKEPEPGFNAESYAGAATELWAQKFCKKDFIPPKDGHKA